MLSSIKRVCDRNLGMQEVILVLEEENEKKALRMPFRVEMCEEFDREMKKIVGEDCLKVK